MKARETHLTPGSVGECERMNSHIPKATSTWGVGVMWTTKSLGNNCRDQNPLDWRVFYIIEKLLKCKCLKWAHITHLDIWNIKLWPKERSGVKLTVWLSTTKSEKSTRFPYVQVACDILLKALEKGYNFSLNLISIEGLHTKL
jgi:hypothetical protein